MSKRRRTRARGTITIELMLVVAAMVMVVGGAAPAMKHAGSRVSDQRDTGPNAMLDQVDL